MLGLRSTVSSPAVGGPCLTPPAAACRFPQVTSPPFVRFYCGAPLVSSKLLIFLLQALNVWLDSPSSVLRRRPAHLALPPASQQVSTEGCVLGSLAVMDVKPRTVSAGAALGTASDAGVEFDSSMHTVG